MNTDHFWKYFVPGHMDSDKYGAILGLLKFPQSWISRGEEPPAGPSDPFAQFLDYISSIRDPLCLLGIIFACLFVFFYFANELICQLIGLFYPARAMYYLLNSRNTKTGPLDATGRSRSLMAYFIIYSHIEIATHSARMLSLPIFYHLKILVLLSLIYMAEYQPEWLRRIYDKTVFYDRVMLRLANSIIGWVSSEARKAGTGDGN